MCEGVARLNITLPSRRTWRQTYASGMAIWHVSP